MVSCSLLPARHSSGAGDGSAFFTAARVAEAAGRAQAEGDKRRCSRRSRVIVTAEECRARFLAGDPVCVNEFHGRCSTGALEAAKEGKTMKKRDHFSVPTDTAPVLPDLPEDMDRPFSLGGYDFGPAPQRRTVGSHLAAVTTKSLSLRTGVISEHDLRRFSYARIAVSTDSKALAVKFYTDKRPGARKIQLKRRSNALIAMEPLTAKHPEWIGREAALEWMGVEGWFLMRLDGENGEAA